MQALLAIVRGARYLNRSAAEIKVQKAECSAKFIWYCTGADYLRRSEAKSNVRTKFILHCRGARTSRESKGTNNSRYSAPRCRLGRQRRLSLHQPATTPAGTATPAGSYTGRALHRQAATPTN